MHYAYHIISTHVIIITVLLHMKVKYPIRQHIDAPQSFNISLNVLNIDMNTGLFKYKI
jgi:hypothetical protein